MRIAFRLGVAAAVALATAPAWAEPSALIKCDGYGRRQTPGEQLGRIVLITSTLGLFGSAEADQPSARKAGAEAIAACTEALTDSRTTGNPVRRAEVLLMRAIRNYEMGKLDAAWADTEAAKGVELTPLVRARFDQNIGASATFVQAIIRLTQGKQDEAEALAMQAAKARPWGVVIAEDAARVAALSPAISTDERAVLDRLNRIAPNVRRAGVLEAAGDWAGASADLAQVIAGLSKPGVIVLARHAAVMALAGDTAGAETLLARVAQEIDELAVKANGTTADARTAEQQVSRADELVQLAKAQVALNKGQTDAAKDLLAGRTRWLAIPAIAATVISNAQAKVPGAAAGIDPAKLRADATKVARDGLVEKGVLNNLVQIVPRWEDADVAGDFGKDMGPASKLMRPKPVRDGAVTLITHVRRAAADTAFEAALVAAARDAAARKADRFAVMLHFGLPRTGREGVVHTGHFIEYVLPGDKLFEAQANRAITVAEVERALGADYSAPVPGARR
jgi:hypothetical protein